MAKRSKEEEQQKLETARKLREKQIRQLKASNEMLEQTKENIIKRYGDDSDTGKMLLNEISTAQEQNIERAQTYLGSSVYEMETIEYDKVDPKEEEAYYERLKKLNKSDELLHLKNVEEQLALYEKMQPQKAKHSRKPKSKLAELNEQLKQLKSYSGVNAEKDEKDDEQSVMEARKRFENDTEAKEAVREVKPIDMPSNRERYGDFDPRDVPSHIQWELIPLPSKGECYRNKMTHIPVAYLTASDENLITSRNLYNSGSMIDIILERKILDKNIRVSDLCKGDRDAIAIWLRATAYGPDYPVIAPYKGEDIETTIDLGDIEYLDFNLKGDENGWFDYTTGNGDVIKFKVLSSGEEKSVLEKNELAAKLINKASVVDYINRSKNLIEEMGVENSQDAVEALEVVRKWVLELESNYQEASDSVYMTYVTDKMISQTMAVNGNTDREYISKYIENMVAGEAYNYRKYVESNVPGVNMNITVQIPESMGGGSFETFLSIGETIFINV